MLSHTGNMHYTHNARQAYAPCAIHLPTDGEHALCMDKNKLFGRAVYQYRKAAKITQGQMEQRILAEDPDYSGLDQAAISKIEKGKHKSPEMHIDAIAKALRVRPSQIMQAVEVMEDGGAGEIFTPPPQPGMVPVPIVGLVRAGTWDQVENPFDPAVAEGYVYTTHRVSRRAYAFEVKGPSMTNPTGWPSFPEGTRVIVDPRLVAESGNLVVAVNDDEEATFKRLVRDGGVTYLVPLNPQFPTIIADSRMRVCGVVVAAAERAISH